MPAKNQALTLSYTAWNVATQAGATGDAANHTLKVVVDGTEAAVAATPVEVDSTNLKGCYKVALTAANLNGYGIYFGGISSTNNVIIIPQSIYTDGGSLPYNAAPGTAGGLPTTDSSNGVKLSVGTGTGQVALASGSVPVVNAESLTGTVVSATSTSVTISAGVGTTFSTSSTAYTQANATRYLTFTSGANKGITVAITGYTPPGSNAVFSWSGAIGAASASDTVQID